MATTLNIDVLMFETKLIAHKDLVGVVILVMGTLLNSIIRKIVGSVHILLETVLYIKSYTTNALLIYRTNSKLKEHLNINNQRSVGIKKVISTCLLRCIALISGTLSLNKPSA